MSDSYTENRLASVRKAVYFIQAPNDLAVVSHSYRIIAAALTHEFIKWTGRNAESHLPC